MDLKFPHHECETAQSESVTHEPFVGHWLHVGLVGLEGTKMSKSLGNLVFVEDLVRNIAGKLMADPRVAWFEVEAENEESIHAHNAFAAVGSDDIALLKAVGEAP